MTPLALPLPTPVSPPDDPTIWRVDDALWARLAPLLRSTKPRKRPGRPRREDRALLDGIIWLLRTGAQWSALPREFGPKSTCHDRLQEWVASGAFAHAWALLLTAYDDLVGLDLTWQVADGCLTKAPLGRKKGAGEALATGSNPTDRGKAGTKRHVLTEGKGIPIGLVISGANRTDMKKLEALLAASLVPYPEDDPAPPAWHLVLDRGYDYPACRQTAEEHHFIPHIPPKSSAARPLPPPGDPDRHPPRRWVVEVAHSWFNRFRRLLIRWEKKADNYLALLHLAATLIIYRKLRHAQLFSG